MKQELEIQMHTQEAVFDGIRMLQNIDEPAATVVWWLHVAKNDNAALQIIKNPDLLQTNEAVKTLAEQLMNEPMVHVLTNDLHQYEERNPEGRAATLWMRTELGVRALMGQPWVKQLVDLGR